MKRALVALAVIFAAISIATAQEAQTVTIDFDHDIVIPIATPYGNGFDVIDDVNQGGTGVTIRFIREYLDVNLEAVPISGWDLCLSPFADPWTGSRIAITVVNRGGLPVNLALETVSWQMGDAWYQPDPLQAAVSDTDCYRASLWMSGDPGEGDPETFQAFGPRLLESPDLLSLPDGMPFGVFSKTISGAWPITRVSIVAGSEIEDPLTGGGPFPNSVYYDNFSFVFTPMQPDGKTSGGSNAPDSDFGGGDDQYAYATGGSGGIGSDETVPDVIQELAWQVEDVVADSGVENSLLSKLENALKSYEKESYEGVEGKLSAFIEEVEGQSGKKIDSDDADALIETAGYALYLLSEEQS